MWTYYVINGQNKQTCVCSLLFRSMRSFPKTGAEGLSKKNLFKGILYNSNELLVEWTLREFQNQTILFAREIKPSI